MNSNIKNNNKNNPSLLFSKGRLILYSKIGLFLLLNKIKNHILTQACGQEFII